MTQEQMTQVVMNRATEMLKDAKINSIYQSFKTETAKMLNLQKKLLV